MCFPQIFICSLARSILKYHLFSFLNNVGLFGLITCELSLPRATFQKFASVPVVHKHKGKISLWLKAKTIFILPLANHLFWFQYNKGNRGHRLTFCLNSSNRFEPEALWGSPF